MAPDQQNDENKKSKTQSNTLMYVAVAVAAIIVVGAIVGYLYLDDQKRQQDARREGLRQTFVDQQNETARLYALLTGYPAPANKNYVDDFRTWAGEYRQLADNYSRAVARLIDNGTEYQQMLAVDDRDYLNVTLACGEAGNRSKAVNATATGYEGEVLARQYMRDNASTMYNLALDRSAAFYNTAWSLMQQSGNYSKFGGYLKYLEACAINNTYYNDSIATVENKGAIYQQYLKGGDYYAVNTTILSLQGNSSKLGQRYAELQKWKPTITVEPLEMAEGWSSERGFYQVQNFRVINENLRNNTEPSKVWNVVVHYTLIDAATGKVRSTTDVSVTMPPSYWSSEVQMALMNSDQYSKYRTTCTVSFEY